MRVSRMILGSAAISFALALGACGFTPMYGSAGYGAGLSDIRVETGEERVDFLLQEALIEQMGSRHADGDLNLAARDASRCSSQRAKSGLPVASVVYK